MATDRELARCRERVMRLTESGVGSRELRLELVQVLQRAIGFERWCWAIGDPASLLAGGDMAEADLWPVVPRIFSLEQQDDPSAAHLLARSREPVRTISAATGGDLERSQTWTECLRPFGIGDQVTFVCRDGHGTWGHFKAWRDRDDRPFAADEAQLLADVAPYLGGALRRRALDRPRAAVPDEAGVATAPPAPAVLILDAGLGCRSWTPEAQAWLELLPWAEVASRRGYLPQAVYAVAARAAARNGTAASLPARIRARGTNGQWVALDAANLEGADGGAVAVTVRTASPGEVLDLAARAWALTLREGELVELVMAGLDTRGIADRLCISPNTVQDHLKAVFAKVGVRTRRELAATLGGTASDGSPIPTSRGSRASAPTIAVPAARVRAGSAFSPPGRIRTDEARPASGRRRG